MPVTMVIAEIGVNHNGDENIAYNLIDASIRAGANCVKFQLYKPEMLAEPGEKREMLERLLLPLDAYSRLSAYAKANGVGFSCTAFDTESLGFLMASTDMAFIKIASPSVHNDALLKAVAWCKKPIIVSTAGATIWQLCHAEGLLAGNKISFLHCVGEYPTPPEKANLKRMLDLKCMHRPIGLSDHSGDIFVPLAAVAMGAEIVECHLTADKNQDGPDHKASLDPAQFRQMVDGMRTIEKAMA